MVLSTTFHKKRFSHFIRTLGHKRSTLGIGDIEYVIGYTCGNTNLLPCPNKCDRQDGYFVSLEHKDRPLSVAYQCSSCKICVLHEFPDDLLPPPDERLFVVELAKTEMNRVESQLHKRLERNIYQSRLNWDNPDPFGSEKTPDPEIDPLLLQDASFWQQPYHALRIGSTLQLQIYRKKGIEYASPVTLLHVIVNNRYLQLGILIGDELFIYYGRDDLKDPASNETYHKMVEYVQNLPKPIYFFDYDYKIFGAGIKEEDYFLVDYITGLEDIASDGLGTWQEEIQKEFGPKHFLSGEPLQEASSFEEKFRDTLQAFEMVLVIKRRIIEDLFGFVRTKLLVDVHENNKSTKIP